MNQFVHVCLFQWTSMVAFMEVMDWWGHVWHLHIQGIFKTHVLGARGTGSIKALQVMAKYGILAHKYQPRELSL